MPGLSGVDLAIQMGAQYPKCKILLFSGQAATLDLLEDARAQGHDFHLLLKPVHPTELLAEIGTLRDGKAPIETARTTLGRSRFYSKILGPRMSTPSTRKRLEER